MDAAMKLVLGATLLLALGLVGCEKTLYQEEKTHVTSSGEVKKEQTTVVQRPDGTIVKEKTESKSEAP